MPELCKPSSIGDLSVMLWFDYDPPEPKELLYPGADAQVVLNAIEIVDADVTWDVELEDILLPSVLRDLEQECMDYATEQSQADYDDYIDSQRDNGGAQYEP